MVDERNQCEGHRMRDAKRGTKHAKKTTKQRNKYKQISGRTKTVKGEGALFILGKYYQHSWWGRVGGMPMESKGVWKEKPLEFPPRMKTFLLLPAAGIEPTTSLFGASLRIPFQYPWPLSSSFWRCLSSS